MIKALYECAVPGVVPTSKVVRWHAPASKPAVEFFLKCLVSAAAGPRFTHKSHHIHSQPAPQTTLPPKCSQRQPCFRNMHRTDLAWTMDMCPPWRCRWHWRLWICPALRWSRSIELLLLLRRRRRPNMLPPARITTSASASTFAHSLLPCSLFL